MRSDCDMYAREKSILIFKISKSTCVAERPLDAPYKKYMALIHVFKIKTNFKTTKKNLKKVQKVKNLKEF